MEKEFSLLDYIIKRTLKKNSDFENFDIDDFIGKMEYAFKRLGFREPNVTVGGGVQNILCLCTVGGQGDFLCLTPALRAIRKNFPASRITLVVKYTMIQLARRCPYANEVISVPYDINYGDNPLHAMKVYKVHKFIRPLWKRRFSLAFDFRVVNDWRGALLLFLSGAKERVTYVDLVYRIYRNRLVPKEESLSYKLLTHPVLFPKGVVHDVEKCLYLLKTFGLNVQSNYCEIFYTYSDILRAQKLLKGFAPDKVLVGVGIGALDVRRAYPPHLYMDVFEFLSKRRNVAFVIFGGPDDIEAAKWLVNHMPRDAKILNLAGRSGGWNIEAAIMLQLDMYIGNSTGLYDVAAAVHKPIVATNCDAKDRKFMAVSIYTRYFPWQNPSIVLRPPHLVGEECKKQGRKHVLHACQATEQPCCIATITPEEIIAAYDRMMTYMYNARRIKVSPIMRNSNPVANMRVASKLRHEKFSL